MHYPSIGSAQITSTELYVPNFVHICQLASPIILNILQELLFDYSKMASPSARSFPSIKAIRTFVVDGVGSGGDYHNVEGGHWYVINFLEVIFGS
jgi:hypothetical protein